MNSKQLLCIKERIKENLSGKQITDILDSLILEALWPIIHNTRLMDDYIQFLMTVSIDRSRRKYSLIDKTTFTNLLFSYMMTTDPENKIRILRKLKLERNIAFALLARFMQTTQHYTALYQQLFAANPQQRSRLLQQLMNIEKDCKTVNQLSLYSTIRHCGAYYDLAADFKNRIIEKYIRLAFNESVKAKNRTKLQIDHEELFDNLILSISKAIDKYDSGKGALTSYIGWWFKDGTNQSINSHEYGIAYDIPSASRRKILLDTKQINIIGQMSEEDEAVDQSNTLTELLAKEAEGNMLRLLRYVDTDGLAIINMDIPFTITKEEIQLLQSTIPAKDKEMPAWNEINPQSYDNKPRIEELVDVMDLSKSPNKKHHPIRLFGDLTSIVNYWFEIKAPKSGKIVRIPKTSLSWNPVTETFDTKKPDPYKKLADKYGVRGSRVYYSNVIDRKKQKQAPSKIRPTKQELKTGFKDKDSDTFTPVRVLPMGSTVATDTKSLIELNMRKNPKTGEKVPYPPNHPRFGFDIGVRYDKDAKGAAKWSGTQKLDAVALTEEEKAYLPWDLSVINSLIDSPEVAKQEVIKIEKILVSKDKVTDDDDVPDIEADDDDVDDDAIQRKKKKSGAKASKEEMPWDDDEDEVKPAKKKGKKVTDEDEDEDELDFEEEDEDETDHKSKSKSAKKSRKANADADDDEDDADTDDDDDEEDKKPAKSGKSKSKKSVDEDEDEVDFDSFDLDDDDDEDEKPKKKKKVVDDDDDEDEKPKKKKKVVDDDDDEDEKPKKKKKVVDDDDDEDEKPKKKKKVVDDDDDDEDEKPVKRKPAAKKKK